MTAATSIGAGARSAPQEDMTPRADEAWPVYAADEIDAVARVLRSGKVNQWTGPDVFAFERACEAKFGGGHGIALANGSLALELVLKAFGIGPGDEVIVTPRSFAASAFCVRLVGATPVFADVEADSGNISPATVAPLITERTRAIIPVHLAGWPADIEGLMALAAPRGIKVIEDCAQAHGAMIGGRSVGGFGDAAAFSFCQDKIISTGGEGGYLSIRDEAAAEWAWSFKDHGKNRAKMAAPTTNPGVFKWVHDQVGTNWRLTGPQAAIGLAQLAKLDDWTEARARNAAIWTGALAGVNGLTVPRPGPGLRHACYKHYFYLDAPEGEAERLRSAILQRASADGLRVFSGSCSEMYREQAFADLPAPDCPVARRMGGNALMVEVHPTLRPDLVARRAGRLAAIIAQVIG